uniref:Uncharacterized protein n=1 Tax=Arundo donax TaxID=35708 RepID=A0A0A9SGI6_ARUDO
MNRIHNTLVTNCAIANQVMQGDIRRKSIHEVMELVVEYGAEEQSDEHFMANQLFVKAEYRDMFTSKEGRSN